MHHEAAIFAFRPLVGRAIAPKVRARPAVRPGAFGNRGRGLMFAQVLGKIGAYLAVAVVILLIIAVIMVFAECFFWAQCA